MTTIASILADFGWRLAISIAGIVGFIGIVAGGSVLLGMLKREGEPE